MPLLHTVAPSDHDYDHGDCKASGGWHPFERPQVGGEVVTVRHFANDRESGLRKMQR